MPWPDHHLATCFAAAMDRLGPYEPGPALAIAVSGGADSMALAILAKNWVTPRGGSAVAMIVDHGLRPASAHEAQATIERLAQIGISAMLLPLSDLRHGSGLAQRARIMRYQALSRTCREAGILHLLLGHHAADQIETLAMRVLRGSQTHGLAGMSALVETADVRLLRPLLEIRPAVLRGFLARCGVGWVEDPSNQDTRATRARLRQRLLSDTHVETALLSSVSAVAHVRSRQEIEIAEELARRATIRPEGFAMLSPGRIAPAALSSLIRSIAGAHYPPSPAGSSNLAADLRPATIAGVRIVPAGRFGDGWLIVREEASIMDPVSAFPGAVWDNRFVLVTAADFPPGAMIGKLGIDAVRFRRLSDLPSAVLRTLPAVRFGKDLAVAPHVGYVCDEKYRQTIMLFAPRTPVAGSAFLPGCRA